MGRKQEKPAVRRHSDPGKELALDQLRALLRLREGAELQIAGYQDEIVRAHGDVSRVCCRAGTDPDVTAKHVQAVQASTAARITAAGEGVERQRAVVISIGDLMRKEIEAAGLDVNDLEFLYQETGE
jgi:hypothetical protein